MDITIIEAPRTTAFTTIARMHRELGLTTDAQDERLTDLIEEVSAEVVSYCNRAFARQTVTERQTGLGRTVQPMSVRPVPRAGLTAVRFSDAVVSGCVVSDPDAGFVFNRSRFADTRPIDQWIERSTVNMIGAADYEFDYSGGYIMPGDDITTSGTATASAVDNSFEISGDTFPILVSGEVVTVVGFADDDNNGAFTVLTRTPTKITVSATLVTETPSGVVSFVSRTLPRDLELAVVQEVRYRYHFQRVDPNVKAESLGDWSVTYGQSTPAEISEGGFHPAVARALDRYIQID